MAALRVIHWVDKTAQHLVGWWAPQTAGSRVSQSVACWDEHWAATKAASLELLRVGSMAMQRVVHWDPQSVGWTDEYWAVHWELRMAAR